MVSEHDSSVRLYFALSFFVAMVGPMACCRQGAAVESIRPPPGTPETPHNLVRNASFDRGASLPWASSISEPARGVSEIPDEALCLRIDAAGSQPWDAQLAHRQLPLRQGHSYQLDFRAWSSAPTRVRPKLGMTGPPYTEYWATQIGLQTDPVRYRGHFTMPHPDDSAAELAFHMGGALAASVPVTVCIDELYLTDPHFDAEEEAPEKRDSPLVANQHGYLPDLAKVAVLQSSASQPLSWRLLDSGGHTVAEGETRALGFDLHSGNSVHQIDFSDFRQTGTGYVLSVGDAASHPFDVSYSIYEKLKYDALAYFYHNRSGIALEMPFCAKQQWARPAGHLPDRAHCAAGIGCGYTLDVSKGWYDAGDHGKYVVNGGISTWTLLNQYERANHLGCPPFDFGDGTLSIPERANGVADLLDEARWELEFLLAMQVPLGQPLSGMVHHKMHDRAWTRLGLRPDQETGERVLRPPSTAATLNLAAVAAQAARSFVSVDPEFGARCLEAARSAFAAAVKHPALYAPVSDNVGGGPYDDDYVQDEFYWAAAELFITTGESEYESILEANPHHHEFLRGAGTSSGMTWGTVDALGVISLAVAPSRLSPRERERLRRRLVDLADAYLVNVSEQGYRTPMRPAKSGYPWGSNSLVLTNALFLALAYDFTQQPEYLGGVGAAMDYLLGTNPLSQSYVTGFGEQALQNPHHRFWARQARADFPPPPPGAVSGGPNSGLQDPYAKAAGLQGCSPQKCFVDHIEAWSVNEVAINWNAPLAWVAAFLDEQGRRSASATSCPASEARQACSDVP